MTFKEKENNFISLFESFLFKELNFRKSESLLLAVSGGADSTALIYICHKLKLNFALAHCNFNLRGEESKGDEVFIENLASQLEKKVFVKHFDTEKIAKSENLTIQETARNLRYEWLESIRKENEYSCIATAHHHDDSIETFFINLLRGSGLNGLCGIPKRNGKVIRPLLFAQRQQIEHFLEENDFSYRTDSSNIEEKYTRNKIRHKLIPIIEELNPDFRKVFYGNFEKLQSAQKMTDEAVNQLKKKLLKKSAEGEIFIAAKKLFLTPQPELVLNTIIKEFGFSPGVARQICLQKDFQSGKQFLAKDYRLIIDRNHFIISNLKVDSPTVVIINKEDEKIQLDGYTYVFSKVKNSSDLDFTDPETAFFNYNKIEFPLRIRSRMKGDYFYPYGMGLKKKKISDFFTDQKIPLSQKDTVRILCSGKKIAWVIGYRTDERFRVNKKNNYLLKVERRVSKD